MFMPRSFVAEGMVVARPAARSVGVGPASNSVTAEVATCRVAVTVRWATSILSPCRKYTRTSSVAGVGIDVDGTDVEGTDVGRTVVELAGGALVVGVSPLLVDEAHEA